MCLSCEDIARQSCAMVPRWRFLATFLRPVCAASRVRQVSDLHLKFALRPHHVWKQWLNSGGTGRNGVPPPLFGRATIRLGIGPHCSIISFLWSPYVMGQTIFSCCGLFFFFFFFSSPNLNRRRSDVCHTSTHSAALVRL